MSEDMEFIEICGDCFNAQLGERMEVVEKHITKRQMIDELGRLGVSIDIGKDNLLKPVKYGVTQDGYEIGIIVRKKA
jgi:hypothetical protein